MVRVNLCLAWGPSEARPLGPALGGPSGAAPGCAQQPLQPRQCAVYLPPAWPGRETASIACRSRPENRLPPPPEPQVYETHRASLNSPSKLCLAN